MGSGGWLTLLMRADLRGTLVVAERFLVVDLVVRAAGMMMNIDAWIDR